MLNKYQSLFTWVASSMCDHRIDKAILQEKVVTDIGARGIVAVATNNALWASVPHLHFSKLDECNRVKLRRKLLGTLIYDNFMIGCGFKLISMIVYQ